MMIHKVTKQNQIKVGFSKINRYNNKTKIIFNNLKKLMDFYEISHHIY